MEMKSTAKAESQRLPPQPPPYTPAEPSPSPAVIHVPPAVNANGSTTMPQNTTTVPSQRTVVTGNIVIPKKMGPTATPYVCPSCNHMIVTKVETSRTTKQHLIALVLCGIGCWPCVCIPYCMSSCRKAHHYCPICNSYIGTYV